MKLKIKQLLNRRKTNNKIIIFNMNELNLIVKVVYINQYQ